MESKKKQRSREAMESALLLLLKKRPLDEISVTDLSKKAGVNRSTFYAHYLDIYDLMDKVTERFVKQMFRDVISAVGDPVPGGGYNAKPLILSALELTLRNKELCRTLIMAKANISGRLIDEALSWCKQRYTTFSNGQNKSYEAEYTMMIGGTVILWYDWIRSDFAVSKEELAGAIERFLEANIKMIWA